MIKRTDGEVKAYVDGYNACYEKFVEILLGRNGVNTAIRKMEMLKTAVNNTLLSDSSNLSAPIPAKWINETDDTIECSNCHHIFDDFGILNGDTQKFWEYANFCPNCGAKMKT